MAKLFYKCEVCNDEFHIFDAEITKRGNNKFVVCPECGNLIIYKEGK